MKKLIENSVSEGILLEFGKNQNSLKANYSMSCVFGYFYKSKLTNY